MRRPPESSKLLKEKSQRLNREKRLTRTKHSGKNSDETIRPRNFPSKPTAMDRFLSIFGALLFIQSALALIATMRFTRYALRRRSARQTRYQPKAVVIVPCRGLEHGFEENVHAILTQDYRDYEVVFVTESENDPAHGVLARLLKQRRRLAPPTWMVVAGEAKNRGQKIHNLLAALDTLNSIGRVEALVFA